MGHEALGWIAGWLVWPRGTCFPLRSWRGCGASGDHPGGVDPVFTLTGPDVAFLRKFHSRVSVLGAGVHYSGAGIVVLLYDQFRAAR